MFKNGNQRINLNHSTPKKGFVSALFNCSPAVCNSSTSTLSAGISIISPLHLKQISSCSQGMGER
jgi:hypothetical protein